MTGPDSRPALAIHDLSKAFPAVLALDRVSLEIEAGEVHALVGHNGSGKSTLIKVLSGCETPEPGAVITVGSERLQLGSPRASLLAGCRFVHQDLGLIDSLSIADNMALVGGWPTTAGTIRVSASRHRAAEALAAVGLRLDPEHPVGELSPALRTGVAIARALQDDERSQTALLVLDEPTATLPLPEVETLHRLIRKVAEGGVGVLFVSHRLEEVLEISDRVTVLRNGRRVASRRTTELSHDDLVTAMLGFELEHVVASAEPPRGAESAAPALEVRDLRARILRGIDLELQAGQVVGIAGIEGSGRDDLLPAIYDGVGRRAGRIAVSGRKVDGRGPRASLRAGIAYVPADREHLASLPGITARESVTVSDLRHLSRAGRIRRGAEKGEVAAWFERLDVRPCDAFESLFESFSGGNRQKLVLARALRCRPAVLLLEEPSQGVDVGAQARMHREILDFAANGGGVLVSSSDTEELARLCHRVLVIRAGEIVAELTQDNISDTSISRALFAEDGVVA